VTGSVNLPMFCLIAEEIELKISGKPCWGGGGGENFLFSVARKQLLSDHDKRICPSRPPPRRPRLEILNL